MSKQLEADRRKNNIAKIFLAVIATIIIIVMVCLLLLKGSNAFLTDRGKWTESEYTVGRIDYVYNINNQEIELDEKGQQILTATVPIIGGVKINDTVQNEKFAEENFNEGVTVAHIVINNKSDFAINGEYEMIFNDMFDKNNKDIFYLILPQGSVLDTTNKTVGGVSYKNYIKNAMENEYSTYAEMIASLNGYYTKNAGLKKDKFNMQRNGKLEFDILFWSEYDQLPFVKDGDLIEMADPNSSIKGTFNFSLEIAQETENTTVE